MISYAQNGEDVVLSRLFTGEDGFYVDLGAGHPVIGSATKHFADLGWRGIIVEPLPDLYGLLAANRPSDVCCRAAVTDYSGTVTLYIDVQPSGATSTIMAEHVTAMTSDTPLTTLEVEAVRLSDLLAEHDVDRIDLLKIDVEGAEATIIEDTDWSVITPRVVLVRATKPTTRISSHKRWEGRLLGAGYVCTLFDGLNRFYVQATDGEAVAALSTPVNVLDGAEPYRFVQRIRDLEDQLRAERATLGLASASTDRPESAESDLAAFGRALGATADEARRLVRLADPGNQFIPLLD